MMSDKEMKAAMKKKKMMTVEKELKQKQEREMANKVVKKKPIKY